MSFIDLLSLHFIRTIRWRTALIIIFFILIVSLSLSSFSYETTNFEVNKPWQGKDIVAEFDFAIQKAADSLVAEKRKIEEGINPVFVWDSLAQNRTKTLINQLFTHFSGKDSTYYIDNIKLNILEQLARAYEKGILSPFPAGFQKEAFLLRKKANHELVLSFSDAYMWDSVLSQLAKTTQILPPLAQKKVIEILRQSVQANYVYNDSLTQIDLQRQLTQIATYQGKVAAKSSIIRTGEIINPQKAQILQAYFREKNQSSAAYSNILRIISRMLIVSLLIGILLVYLRYNRTRIFYDARRLMLILTVIGLVVISMGLSRLLVQLFDYSTQIQFIYLVPACIAPIVISSFFDSRTSSMCNLVVALFGAVLVQQSTEYAFLQAVAGTVAVYSMRLVQKREVFFLTLAYILLAYLVSFVIYQFYTYPSLGWNFYIHLILLALNISFTIFAYPLIFLLEKIFKVSSALSYLELTDTSHPLLDNLSLLAPGTFQHTLQVANIAKKAVADIGGNALLTYTGALFHDIGKMKNPSFFIENFKEQDNPHANLKPEESAAIVLDHVIYGIELAKRYKLPQEIIDFIQTHHGTTRVEYFYRKYTSQNAITLLTESHFTYRGPKPHSKEMAVVMIADSIEAASRTLRSYEYADLENLVTKIIQHKIQGEQLDNSGLTFKDIGNIKKSILNQLVNIYHRRLEYPE